MPSVPSGTKLDFASPEFLEAEGLGLQQAAHTAFVLVAGGLGERLGYSGAYIRGRNGWLAASRKVLSR